MLTSTILKPLNLEAAKPFPALPDPLLPGAGSLLLSFGAAASSCSSAEKTCDGKCIPSTGSCCATGTGGYCEAGKYCVSGGCCQNGKTCTGAPQGCSAGKVLCNGFCIPTGGVCCPSGGYCDPGRRAPRTGSAPSPPAAAAAADSATLAR
ncbi:hypothetical protein Ct61P_03998 [Colletotrichum tofieldiae]|nr:hypothetical protein Ct61P_03998 [Colletotrichum tofieldiae]